MSINYASINSGFAQPVNCDAVKISNVGTVQEFKVKL